MSAKTYETRAVSYTLEVRIDAPRRAVWDALTSGIDAWWLPDFHMTGAGSVLRFDARAGGQLIEERADGSGLLWYTVNMCIPGESLHMSGFASPEWGGPHSTLLHLALEEHDGVTVLRVEDALFGHVTDSHVASVQEGWTTLFRDGLKAHVEAAAG